MTSAHPIPDLGCRLRQLLNAKCRLAVLPSYLAAAPQLQQLRAHVLPALHDALNGFAKLRCHAEAAEVHTI